VTAVRAPRHRHSPRIRRRARDWGIDVESVIGTGPVGRVTEDDLRAANSSPGPSAGGIAGLQVAVRTALAGDRDGLLAVAGASALAALRRCGVGVTSVGLTTDGGTAVVPGAHDLTVAALCRRLAERPPDAPCDVRVLDAGEVDAQVALPRPGERAVLAVGAVRDDVTVERRTDGVMAFVARPVVTVTVATAAYLAESVSADVLRQVAFACR
jgi:pyruvate/2-oxoglutarate dehydrogenase complex dihydrolipoamide acyltransferase (E2) component